MFAGQSAGMFMISKCNVEDVKMSLSGVRRTSGMQLLCTSGWDKKGVTSMRGHNDVYSTSCSQDSPF